ncbi:MAG: DNA translocase FtsK 4TM domain-containing protein [Bacteroidales bacterium]|jgi:S-DNA-T family DNA segregation ATPase FtsK/SpoIIIE|nr:DNA translocase FtsK 4TM domain-containing protein [Bacteroidales bacterium]
MSSRTNKIKTNKLKDKPKPKPEKKKRVRKSRREPRAKKPVDPRVRRITGFIFLVIAIYLLLAIISFFVNWFEADVKDFKDHTEIVKNWTGSVGVWLSGYMVKVAGIGSFFIPVLLFSIGLRMMAKIKMFSFWIWFQIIIVGLLWLPLVFKKLFSEHPWDILGGITGSQLNIWLTNYLGPVGLILLIILVPAIFILIDFRISFSKLKVFAKKDDQIENEINTAREDIYNTVEFAVDEDESDFEEVKSKKVADDSFKIEVDKGIDGETPDDASGGEIELTIEETVAEEKTDKVKPGEHFGIDTSFDPTLDLPNFKMPPLDLLSEYDDGDIRVDKEELEANKNKIVETLNHYSISITKIKATIGPTITLYEIVPAPGIRISKIKNLEDDIALSLSAMGIRIIAPIPGKGTVGIEVPNKNPTIVSMRSILASERFQSSKYELPFGLGKTVANESYVADLAKMPHILMAGATGQGKSVGLNAIIASLLYKKHPAELKFILVDPKKVELTLYSKIERHYLAKLPDSEEAIITDTRKVVRTLNSLGIEMDNRYELLKDAQVRNVKEYNTKFIARKLNPNHGHRYLPYFVLVVDEFADLIMTAGKEVEGPITRLAQLARAVGIHLIIATQRPSVNIITGTIKANFPARIAFRVISKIDSRTILDTGGADQLVGRGDMLLSTGNDLIRLQCAFIDTPEVDTVTDFIGAQRAYPDAYHLPEYYDEEVDSKNEFDPNDRDELFEDAARIIVQTQQGSTSLLQRKLKLGYNRAGRIIDQLEAAGIVGPFEGSKAREVKVANEMALEQFLKDLDMNKNDNI